MSKNRKFLVGALLTVGVCTLAFILASCGERQENAKYYSNPSWLRGGSVVYLTTLQTTRKDAIGTQLGSSTTTTVTTGDAAGTGENFLFDVTDAPAYSMSCAPTSDYIAYLDNLQSNLFHRIVIRNIAGGAHSGLDQVELAFNPGIISFDWASDSQRLVYCTTGEVRTILRDGSGDTLVVAAADLTFVSWKYGDRIAYVHGGLLSVVYPDGTGQVDLAAAASVDKPQISAANTNEVYGISGTDYCVVNVNAAARAVVSNFSFKGDLPRLSSAADKVVYSKASETSGLYILTLATSAESKIK